MACGGPPELLRPIGPVVLLGVDGLSWKVIGPGIEGGTLPAFGRLQAEGAWAPDFEVVSPDSPIAWTSVATGRAPEDHGVISFVSQLPSGEIVPASSGERRLPALWDLATRHGRSVGVVGWWATWPVEPVNGYVVSDHANPAATGFLIEDGRYWTADPEALTQLRLDVYPETMAQEIGHLWSTLEQTDWVAVGQSAGLTTAQLEILRSAPPNRRTPYSLWKTYYLVDRPHVSLVKERLARDPTDLTMLYLRGPDPVQHYAWDLVEPERYVEPPAHLERDRGLVEAVYRTVDRYIAELLEVLPEDGWLIVASDHGAEPASPLQGRPGGHTKSAKGVLFLWGPGARAGERLAATSPYDLAPTILWMLGLPLSEELEGRVLREAFNGDLADREVDRVRSYGPRSSSGPRGSAEDEVLLERLRDLGYID